MKNFIKTLKPSFLALDAHLYEAFTKIVTTWLNFTNHKTNQKKKIPKWLVISQKTTTKMFKMKAQGKAQFKCPATIWQEISHDNLYQNLPHIVEKTDTFLDDDKP